MRQPLQVVAVVVGGIHLREEARQVECQVVGRLELDIDQAALALALLREAAQRRSPSDTRRSRGPDARWPRRCRADRARSPASRRRRGADGAFRRSPAPARRRCRHRSSSSASALNCGSVLYGRSRIHRAGRGLQVSGLPKSSGLRVMMSTEPATPPSTSEASELLCTTTWLTSSDGSSV